MPALERHNGPEVALIVAGVEIEGTPCAFAAGVKHHEVAAIAVVALGLAWHVGWVVHALKARRVVARGRGRAMLVTVVVREPAREGVDGVLVRLLVRALQGADGASRVVALDLRLLEVRHDATFRPWTDASPRPSVTRAQTPAGRNKPPPEARPRD